MIDGATVPAPTLRGEERIVATAVLATEPTA